MLHLIQKTFLSPHCIVAMALDDAGKREFIQRNVTSDLQYIWGDSEVSLDLQYRFAHHYKPLCVCVHCNCREHCPHQTSAEN